MPNNNPLTFAYAPADIAVLNGRERERYIKDGRISLDAPNNPRISFPLDADALDRRGYHEAAHAQRGYDHAMALWRYGGGFGRRPTR